MSRRHLLVALAAAALVGRAAAEVGPSALLRDDFAGDLDPARWEVVRVHDAREDRVAVEGGRLVLGLDTLGTDDATVKLRGLRSRAAFDLEPGTTLRVGVTIDWNDPTNGCYLTAGLALVPEGEASDDPRAAAQALGFEWVGVPPGKHVRPWLWLRARGALRPLYAEGWPQPRREDRVGRHVRVARVTLELSPGRVRLLEDGAERFAGEAALEGPLRLVLFVTGHSNYPARCVFMDDVEVERVAE